MPLLSVVSLTSGAATTAVLWLVDAAGGGGGNDHLFGVAAIITAVCTGAVALLSAVNNMRRPTKGGRR